MSHDDEATASPRHGARNRGPAGLDRPSLFADFDQNEVEDIEPQRVRLLSALESQRGRTPRPRSRRTPTQARSPWATRGLMIAMGVGVLIVLISFIEVLRRPPPPRALPQAQAASAAAQAVTSRQGLAPALAAAPTAPSNAVAAAAEIIEVEAPAAGLPEPATTTVARTVPQATGATPTSAPPVNKMLSTAAADVARLNADTAPAAGTRGAAAKRDGRESKEGREGSPRNDDVALLEAMFAHSGTRRAAPAAQAPTASARPATPPASTSTSEALRQCGGASSADAAVCRARVCVQNPSASACHGERP